MLKTSAVLFGAIVAAAMHASAQSPDTGRGRLLPDGYTTEQEIAADLNQDGRKDVAMLIVPICTAGNPEPLEIAECRAEARELRIALRGADDKLVLSVAVPVRSGVGVHGDHFDKLEIHGRTFSLSGGSTSCAGQTGRSDKYQYRFQDGDWMLIGHVERSWELSVGCGNGEDSRNTRWCPQLALPGGEFCVEREISTNFNTGQMQEKWTVARESDERQRTILRRTVQAKQPLRRLRDERLEF